MPAPPPPPSGEGPDAPGGSEVSAAENFAADERRLESATPTARAAALTDRSLSVGVATRDDFAPAERARANGLPVLRRSTGGSGVLHLPGDLVWSVVLPRSDPRVGRDFVQAYERLGRGVVRFLASQGLAARWVPSPPLAPDYCVLSGRGEVAMVGEGVLGGAAQHATHRALLHQGMLARRVDPEELDRLFALPSYARDRLVGLEDLGVTAPAPRLARALEAALRVELGLGSGPSGA